MSSSITPVILTFNEAPNIARTLSALSWAPEVVVVDSGSDDDTERIARNFSNVRFIQREFDSHARQWNFAIGEAGIATEWILALDADYVVTPELADELRDLDPPPEVAGYWAEFRYCIFGKALRGSVYPPVLTLFRKGRGEYLQDGHTQRVHVTGSTLTLRNRIQHDDRKSVSRWIASQNRYMELEADKLLTTKVADLTVPDRIRLALFLAPPLVLLYSLFVKGTILDGRAGLYYSTQRTIAEMLLSLHLLYRYFEGRGK